MASDSRTRKRIECLARLQESNGGIADILDFLQSEALIQKEDIKILRHTAELAKSTEKLLSDLSASNKLQLLEFQWSILPTESIKITMVTDRVSKEFNFDF
jgi:hypothetical protein